MGFISNVQQFFPFKNKTYMVNTLGVFLFFKIEEEIMRSFGIYFSHFILRCLRQNGGAQVFKKYDEWQNLAEKWFCYLISSNIKFQREYNFNLILPGNSVLCLN